MSRKENSSQSESAQSLLHAVAVGLGITSTLSLVGCTNQLRSLSTVIKFSSASSALNLPTDAREINFPSTADMGALKWLDVTQNGAALGCVDAVPNLTDATSVNQTTSAIQCRLNQLNIGGVPGSLYFPPGTYSINATLALLRTGYLPATHILGRDPATTKISWVGSCGYDPNVADPVHIQKYNAMLYASGIAPLTIERLTFEGNNCAGTGLEMVSKPLTMSGIQLNELTFQNLKEVAIVGSRNNITNSEFAYGDTSGMVSEVTITRVTMNHIGYAGILVNAANALDYWISDSLFQDCGIGVTNSIIGIRSVGGLPGSAGLPWGQDGAGNFDVSNSIFKNNRHADVYVSNGERIALRNNFSSGTLGPFIQADTFLFSQFFLQANTVIATAGVVPIVLSEAHNYMVALQNQISTAPGIPVMSVWTNQYWGYPVQLPGASSVVGNLFNEAYSNITSIGNRYSSIAPYSSYSNLTSYSLLTAPSWAENNSLEPFQCAMGNNSGSILDNRTFCKTFAANGTNQNPVYNLVSFDDQLGASMVLAAPSLRPIRPEIARNYIIPVLTTVNTAQAGLDNAGAIQNAIATLALRQKSCATNDYYCPDRWSVIYIPSGHYAISKTIQIPGSLQMKIVGAASSLYWYWYGTDNAGNPAGATPIFALKAPSHVVIQDLTFEGSNDDNFANVLGEGIVAEVTDTVPSRVFSEAMSLWGSFSVNGIGDASFQMKSFQNGGTSTIIGNGAANAGFFAFFGGNPSDLQVGGGTNLMIQDTWYEGPDSSYVTCLPNDSANVTVETSMLSMGGWHGVSRSSQTTFNFPSCKTHLSVIASDVSRDGWSGLAPTQSLILSPSSSAQSNILFLGNATINSTFGTSQDIVPVNFAADLDQGALFADSATPAQYANVQSTFQQTFSDNNGTEVNNQIPFPAKETGTLTKNFIRGNLVQAMDPRLRAPASVVSPITDMSVTDLQFYRVRFQDTRKDVQFILPGGVSN